MPSVWVGHLAHLFDDTPYGRGDFPEYGNDVADDRGGPRNDGRYTYVWEGPDVGSPSQLAVIWWGKAGEPDLMVVYNEHWDPLTVTNPGDWSRGDWKILGRSRSRVVPW